MTDRRPTRDRTGSGAVPPSYLIVGGLLVALVAVVLLVLQLRGDGEPVTVPAPAPPTVTATAPPDEADVTSSEPTWSDVAAPTTAAGSGVTTSPGGDAAEDLGAPAWVVIDAAGVDSTLTAQGLAPDGTINPGPHEVIWFTGSDRVRPGQVGTAVIAAHVTYDGVPDAFVHLADVRVGDVVTVGYAGGASRSFTVTETAAVDKEALARSLRVWGPHPDRPRLAIITCDPVLGYQADGHTEANYVVIAEG